MFYSGVFFLRWVVIVIIIVGRCCVFQVLDSHLLRRCCAVVWIWAVPLFPDLFLGSYLAQLRPCGYSHFNLSIHKDSSCFSHCSVCSAVSPFAGLMVSRSCTDTLFVPAQSPLLKCSCKTPGWCLFLMAVRCLAILDLNGWAVWPTYCLPQCLHWIR